MIHRVGVLGVLAALVLLAPAAVWADSSPRTYTYLIGDGLLCDLAPSACPVIVRAAENDDTIEVVGTGAFSTHPKAASGGGTFKHKDAAGTVIATGSWTAEELLSFKGYGTSPGFPSDFEGGQVLMRVHLSSAVASFDAVMQVDCLIGKAPAGAKEGITLNVQDALNFNQEVSGFTLYIRSP